MLLEQANLMRYSEGTPEESIGESINTAKQLKRNGSF